MFTNDPSLSIRPKPSHLHTSTISKENKDNNTSPYGVENDDTNNTNTSSNASSSSSSSSSSSKSASSSSGRRIKVYTKTGDKGTSMLFNMQRVSKSADTFHALGEVDELNAYIGIVREYCITSIDELKSKHTDGSIDNKITNFSTLASHLEYIQARLFDVGSHVATPQQSSNEAQLQRTSFDDTYVTMLENWIDDMDKDLPPLKNFILPSGGLLGTHLHVARAVCRRAERACIPLLERNDVNQIVGKYLNRLSDFLFVAARYAAMLNDKPEVTWKKPRQARKQSTSTTDASTSNEEPKSP